MSFSKTERDKTRKEEEIIRLVNLVRDFECEPSFSEIVGYLQPYLKLFGRKYRIPGCDSDEIEQECLFALRYKAIDDFDQTRGRFKSFAILCIKRHLFSLIKGNNQQKRRVLNQSLSLDEDRSEDGENLSLINVITEDALSADDEIAKLEEHDTNRERLLSKCSKLEQEVFKLYLKQYHYDEIVEELKKVFPQKRLTKKTVDNSLQRIRSKAQIMLDEIDWL